MFRLRSYGTLAAIFAFVLLAILASSAAASYTTILYPTNYAEPWLDRNRTGYLSVLETLYGAGNFARVDDAWDQIWWEWDGSATAEAKFAGHNHWIGYTKGTSGGTTQWFGTSGSGYTVSGGFSFNFTPNDFLRFNLKDVNTGDVWSSRQSENTLNGGLDHMVTFAITGGASAGRYAICWEDLRIGGGADRDYNDMVLEVRQVSPVPEPGSVILIGLLFLGAGVRVFSARRR